MRSIRPDFNLFLFPISDGVSGKLHDKVGYGLKLSLTIRHLRSVERLTQRRGKTRFCINTFHKERKNVRE